MATVWVALGSKSQNSRISVYFNNKWALGIFGMVLTFEGAWGCLLCLKTLSKVLRVLILLFSFPLLVYQQTSVLEIGCVNAAIIIMPSELLVGNVAK